MTLLLTPQLQMKLLVSKWNWLWGKHSEPKEGTLYRNVQEVKVTMLWYQETIIINKHFIGIMTRKDHLFHGLKSLYKGWNSRSGRNQNGIKRQTWMTLGTYKVNKGWEVEIKKMLISRHRLSRIWIFLSSPVEEWM